MSRARVKPTRPPSRLAQVTFAAIIVALGFTTLMVRLEVTQEGYRLSTLRSENLALENENRELGVRAAELGSNARLRKLARKFGLGPPAHGQVVTLP
jgi:cell division protein FtsL